MVYNLREMAVDILTGTSWESFLGISADSRERFPGISANFPQNCYLGRESEQNSDIILAAQKNRPTFGKLSEDYFK